MEPSTPKRETVEQLAEEFVERYRRGEQPDVSEYAARYPHYATQIRDLFPALVMLEQIAPGSDSAVSASAATGPASPPGALPERLGDYRILREVGRGGMGIVYEAEQVSLGRHVALKVLSQALLLDARLKKRFEREAKAAAKLHHTNIVPVFGVGEDRGLHYYVMQFIQGLGLDEVLAEVKRLRTAGGRAPAPGPAGKELRTSPRPVSAAAVARSLLTGEFRRSGSSPMFPGEGEPLPGDETVHHDEGISPTPVPLSVTGKRSDTRSLSASSVVLPGQNEGAGRGRRPTYWSGVAQVGVQVAGALEHAHQQGVLHRDIKPANLLVDTHGNVWVTDFGLAKADDQENLTHTGDVLGTLRYMAPEVFDGKSDARSEVYSLGLTLYELLELRPAFDECDRNRLIKQVIAGERLRLRKVRPDVPHDLATIVEKASERDPRHRYQTAGELRADLERFLEDEPVRARRSGPLERAWRWCRRNPRVAVLSGQVLLLVSLLGVGGAAAAWKFARQAEAQRLLAEEARRERQKADEARAKAESEAERASREAATADQVTAFLAGLFEPRDRLTIGAMNMGFSLRQGEALRASDLLARGVERLNTPAGLKEQPLVRARLLQEIGTIYLGLGEVEPAAPLLEEALRLRRRLLPADHPDLAISLPGVAQVRYVRDEGDNMSAADLYREAIAILEAQPDAESLELAETETSLALCLLATDRDEGARLITHALAIRRRRLDEHDLQTLTTLWQLAHLYYQQGDFLRAVPLLAQVLRGLEQSKADPGLIACVRLIADALQTRIRKGIAAAVPAWRAAAAQLRQVVGEHHFLTVWVKMTLADTLYYSVSGADPALAEAVRLYEEALESIRAWGSPRRSERAQLHLNLGRTLRRLGRPEAEKHLLMAVTLYRQVRLRQAGGGLPHALQALASIRARLTDPTKRAEVESLLREAAQFSCGNPEVPAYRQAHALLDYGRFRLTQGDAALAAPLFADVVQVRSAAFGRGDVQVGEALAFQSAALRLLGRTEQAEARRKEAEAILQRHAGAQGEAARRARRVLAGEVPPWP